MKKKNLVAAVALLLSASLVTSSCIGSFSLTGKLLKWNRNINSKFVNELVFFAFWVLPVYEVCALSDILVLNSIEFWSGSNPMAKGKKLIDGEDGRYLVECDGKGYTITSQNDGSVVRLDFDEAEQTWLIDMGNGEEYPLMTFVDDTHVRMAAPDGTMTLVELSDNGMMAYRQLATEKMWVSR